MSKAIVQVIPLAPKALCAPHPYDIDNEVIVQLDEPLWVPRPGAKDVAVEIISLCVQLDTIILSSRHRRVEEEGESSAGGGQRKVTFQKLTASKMASILKLMQEHLRRAGIQSSLEDYLHTTSIGYLFPRVELCLQEPDQLLEKVSTLTMDGYFSHLTQLNNVLTMSQQIHSDLSSHSHKYIAHETAQLYRCLGFVPQLAHFKKEIEKHFTDIKSSCNTASEGHPPRLSGPLRTWFLTITKTLVELVSKELLTSNKHVQEVLSIVHNIPP